LDQSRRLAYGIFQSSPGSEGNGRGSAQSKNMVQKKRELESKLKFLDAQITALNSEFEEQKEELNKLTSDDALRSKVLAEGKIEMARIRKADASKWTLGTLMMDPEQPKVSSRKLRMMKIFMN
jgi:circadian clock protein KaiC